MAHVRAQIRDYVAAQVNAIVGLTAYTDRRYKLGAADLPAALVYAGNESIDLGKSCTDASRELWRELDLMIQVVVRAATGSAVDDALAAQLVEIEKKIAADETLGGLAVDTVLADVTPEQDLDGDQLIGTLTINYQISYMTATTDPETAIT